MNAYLSSLARRGFAPNSLAGYAFAAACVAAASLIRLALGMMFGTTLFFVSFFPAVVLSALFAGAGPALLALALSVLITWYFLFQPTGFTPMTTVQIVNMSVYIVCGLFVVWLGQLFRSAVRDLQAEEAERKVILEEVEHRARNMGAMGAAIVQFSLPDDKEKAELINRRMRSLQAANDLITKSPKQQADLESILRQELAPYDIARCTLRGAAVSLPSNAARAVALVMHELITNAVKYGALSGKGGTLDLSWTMKEDALEIEWRENGGPKVGAPVRSGFGTKLIDTTVAGFDGSVDREFHEHGLRCRLRLRL